MGMKSVQVSLPEALVEAAQSSRSNPSAGAARWLALELFREDKVSLGRAAELCETPVEIFMEFAGQRQVPLHYGAGELQDVATLSAVKIVSNASPLITLARLRPALGSVQSDGEQRRTGRTRAASLTPG